MLSTIQVDYLGSGLLFLSGVGGSLAGIVPTTYNASTADTVPSAGKAPSS